jgi:hypothetical protein
MTRPLPRSWRTALLVGPLALASASARAQDAPASPPPAPSEAPTPPTVVIVVPPPILPPEAMPPPVAQPPPAAARSVERDRAPRGNWYGWQTLLAVAPFDIAMFAGLSQFPAKTGVGVFTAGFVGRNLAPAVVHMAHDRVGVGFGSIGLHMAATGTGVAIGYAIGIAMAGKCPPVSTCRNGFRDLPPEPGYGAIAGSMAGTVLDAVFLAHRTKLSWTARSTAPAWALAPFATRTATGLAAGGTF